MDQLEQKLQEIGIKTIVIVDDSRENRDAAESLKEKMPYIGFQIFSRGDMVRDLIPYAHKEIDLILTDREMETPDSGLDVLEMGWRYHIPTLVCSGGYQHRDQPKIRVYPCTREINIPDGMEKSSPETWYKIIEEFVEKAKSNSGVISALIASRKGGTKVPDEFSAEFVRKLGKAELDSR